MGESERESFLLRVANEGGGGDGRFRGLALDPALFERLLAVVDHLDEPVDFSGVHFPYGSDFGGVRFARRAVFNGAYFAGEVRFAGVTFAAAARFNAAIFAGRAVFGAPGPYYFSGSFLNESGGATFLGTAEFIGTRFQDDAQFQHVRFAGDVDFRQAQFQAQLRLDDIATGTEEEQSGPSLFSFARARLEGGVVADLPPARLDATGIELGGASRMLVRGPIELDRVTLDHPLTIVTTNRAEVARLADAGCPPELRSLDGATLQAPLIVGGGVSLRRCSTSGAVGLEKLGLDAGSSPLALHRGRRVLFDEVRWRQGDERRGHRLAERVARRWGRPTWAGLAGSLEASGGGGPRIEPSSTAGRYRQLRSGLEEARNAPGAADFYYGEMEMRRAAAANRFERFFLWLYWLVSGYGLKASRSIAAYVAVVVAVATLFRYGPSGLHEPCAVPQACPDLDDGWSIGVFIVRWSVSIFPSPELAGISTAGETVLLVVRFLAPVLLALTVLAIRARVHR